MKHVVITGITGFLGSHIAIQLLNKGYKVTGTLRESSRENSIRDTISRHSSKTMNLSFIKADLLDEQVWPKVMNGVDYVLHIASPFPRTMPSDDRKIIDTAVQGTLNVLKAASNGGVKKVVMTSSTGAICYGKTASGLSGIYNEKDWTDVEDKADSTPYFRSKTLAEKAAWDFISSDGSGMELTTICPGAILGPVIEKDFGTSANLVIKMMDGSAPAIPNIGFEIVDVRSTAEMHVLAMESDNANGERFVCTSGYRSFKEIAAILRQEYPKQKIPSRILPNFMVRLFSNIDKTLKPILIDLGVNRKVESEKAANLLGWKGIPPEQAILDCARSIFEQGLVKKRT